MPRWEWRTFGEGANAALRGHAGLTPDRVQETDEVYLLSAERAYTVKVRNELMDIKHLEQVNKDGLEQWNPVMKAGFPLTATGVEFVLSALGVSAARTAPAASTPTKFVEELVQRNPDVLAVDVHKRRERFTVRGCMAELTDVRAGNVSTRTFAIESEDAAQVIAALRGLGLEDRPNVSFPRGLKTLVGFGAGRYAVIDVGTNSVKFHIGERTPDGVWHKVVDRAEMTRLGAGLDTTGRLNPAPIERTINAIGAMADEARRDGAKAIAAVGTAGLRIAPNAAELVEDVRARSGISIEIISGEEEGRLAYLAARVGLPLPQGSLVVFDSGGGSSQFTFGHGDQVDERFSVAVGAVRFTERYGLGGVVDAQALATALEAITADFADLQGRSSPNALVGMGGTATNLAAVKHGLATYDPDVVHGTVLDLVEIDRQIELFRTRNADERRAIAGLQPQRADIILAGACILRTVIVMLGRESLVVSDRGLRHGVLIDRFG